MGPSSGFIQPTGFHKMREISSLVGKLLASHEELSCLESVIKYIRVLIRDKYNKILLIYCFIAGRK